MAESRRLSAQVNPAWAAWGAAGGESRGLVAVSGAGVSCGVSLALHALATRSASVAIACFGRAERLLTSSISQPCHIQRQVRELYPPRGPYALSGQRASECVCWLAFWA